MIWPALPSFSPGEGKRVLTAAAALLLLLTSLLLPAAAGWSGGAGCFPFLRFPSRCGCAALLSLALEAEPDEGSSLREMPLSRALPRRDRSHRKRRRAPRPAGIFPLPAVGAHFRRAGLACFTAPPFSSSSSSSYKPLQEGEQPAPAYLHSNGALPPPLVSLPPPKRLFLSPGPSSREEESASGHV